MINLPSWAKVCLAILLAAGLGYASGRYAQPAKEVIKTVEVIKTITVVQHDTVTVTKEITKPDGTKEVDTTVTDKDKDTTDSSMKESASESITNVKPQWKAQALYGYNVTELRPVYGANIERRIIGPISAGLWGNTDHALGVSVSIEF